MSVRLRDSLATTEVLDALFSDAAVLQAMLDFESALARAEAKAGVIPQGAADSITKIAHAENFDIKIVGLSAAGLRAGTLAIPFVKMLTELVRTVDTGAAGYVHWGATSQDVTDTALVLLLANAVKLLADDHMRLANALRRKSDEYAGTVMLARTLLQPAPPTTFGFKIAGWFGAIDRSWTQLHAQFEECRVLQFGGASGTLASLGDKGTKVAELLAAELGISNPLAPWHTQRDRLASLICALGVYVGSLGKMARDVELLMQFEVAEAFEPGGDGRGGSSTMPHKRNPTACAVTLACANRLPGLVSSFLAGMPQEHERAAGAWHAEWATITDAVEATGLALASMVEVAEGLTVDAARMRENIASTRGLIFAERAMMLLGAKIGRDKAHKLMNEAAQRAGQSGRKLVDVIVEMPEVQAALSAEEIATIDKPEEYLGSAETFRKHLLNDRGRA
jgi:3-carboxy-cis,cis-muconate cycloisomerase